MAPSRLSSPEFFFSLGHVTLRFVRSKTLYRPKLSPNRTIEMMDRNEVIVDPGIADAISRVRDCHGPRRPCIQNDAIA
jgi:hypothetical protein